MDAKKIYSLIKPHLELLDTSEKKVLSQLISGNSPKKVTCHHRSITSLAKAKEKLKKVCIREMEREKKEQQLNLG